MKGISEELGWPAILVSLVNWAIALVFGFLNDLIDPFLPE